MQAPGQALTAAPGPLQAAAFSAFTGRNVAPSRASTFSGASLSVKAARIATRKSAVAAQAKVGPACARTRTGGGCCAAQRCCAPCAARQQSN